MWQARFRVSRLLCAWPASLRTNRGRMDQRLWDRPSVPGFFYSEVHLCIKLRGDGAHQVRRSRRRRRKRIVTAAACPCLSDNATQYYGTRTWEWRARDGPWLHSELQNMPLSKDYTITLRAPRFWGSTALSLHSLAILSETPLELTSQSCLSLMLDQFWTINTPEVLDGAPQSHPGGL